MCAYNFDYFKFLRCSKDCICWQIRTAFVNTVLLPARDATMEGSFARYVLTGAQTVLDAVRVRVVQHWQSKYISINFIWMCFRVLLPISTLYRCRSWGCDRRDWYVCVEGCQGRHCVAVCAWPWVKKRWISKFQARVQVSFNYIQKKRSKNTEIFILVLTHH